VTVTPGSAAPLPSRTVPVSVVLAPPAPGSGDASAVITGAAAPARAAAGAEGGGAAGEGVTSGCRPPESALSADGDDFSAVATPRDVMPAETSGAAGALFRAVSFDALFSGAVAAGLAAWVAPEAIGCSGRGERCATTAIAMTAAAAIAVAQLRGEGRAANHREGCALAAVRTAARCAGVSCRVGSAASASSIVVADTRSSSTSNRASQTTRADPRRRRRQPCRARRGRRRSTSDRSD